MQSLALKSEQAVRPPPKLNVWEWADSQRYLSPESSAEPGRWRTSRTPHLREPMEEITNPLCSEIVFMGSAQIGKTEFLNNAVGYFIDHDPCPLMLVQPTVKMGETWSKNRLTPMLRDTPCLRGKVSEVKRSSGNTIHEKKFPGGVLVVSGANSASSLAQRPIRNVFCDDLDRFPASAGDEGDPAELAAKRTTTFWNRLIVRVSTPTLKGESQIERAYAGSDRRRYYVPCPHCDHPQLLDFFKGVVWDKDQDENGKTIKHYPETAVYVCEKCAATWTDADRWRAVARADKEKAAGRGDVGWVGRSPFRGIAGFHINELYSPWSKLAEMAAKFLEAKDDPELLKVFVNTVLGETWEDRGETVQGNEIQERAEDYGPEIPERALILTAGVDVQGDRIELEVVAYGPDEESWSVDYEILHGAPESPEVWLALDSVLSGVYAAADGRALRIAAACIDCGDQQETVLKYTDKRSRWRRNIWAVKGKSGGSDPVWPVRYSRSRKSRKRFFSINVDAAKAAFYNRLRIKPPENGEPRPRYCHFPRTRDAEYFNQLASEKLVKKRNKTTRRYTRVWVKTRDRNEALDCRVYAYAALEGLKFNRNLDLEKIAKRLAQGPKPKPLSPPNGAPLTGGPIPLTAAGPDAPVTPDDPYLK